MTNRQNHDLERTVAVAKAMGDPQRSRILLVLRDGERCVCQLIEMLGLAPSTVSKHLTILRQAGLVQVRKSGRWSYFRLSTPDENPEAAAAAQWLDHYAGECTEANADRRALKGIARRVGEETCDKGC